MIQQRGVAVVGVAASAILVAAVFLPWVAVSGGGGQVAGWGSGSVPRLRGMLVLTCAALAIAMLVSVAWYTAGLRSRVVAGVAAVAAATALVGVIGVLGAPASFAGTSAPASPAPGAWVSLVAAAVTLTAAMLTGVLPQPASTPIPALR